MRGYIQRKSEGGSKETVSKLEKLTRERPEGAALNSPGRQAGILKKYEMSAEGAALTLYESYE